MKQISLGLALVLSSSLFSMAGFETVQMGEIKTVALQVGKTEFVKFKVKGDGKAEPYVISGLTKKAPRLIERGMLTDIRDPRLEEFLRNQFRVEQLIELGQRIGRAGGFVPGGADLIDVPWGKEPWVLNQSFGPKSVETNGIIDTWSELAINNRSDDYYNYIKVQKFTQPAVRCEVELGFIAPDKRLSLSHHDLRQTIEAEYDPSSGRIKEDTIREVFMLQGRP